MIEKDNHQFAFLSQKRAGTQASPGKKRPSEASTQIDGTADVSRIVVGDAVGLSSEVCGPKCTTHHASVGQGRECWDTRDSLLDMEVRQTGNEAVCEVHRGSDRLLQSSVETKQDDTQRISTAPEARLQTTRPRTCTKTCAAAVRMSAALKSKTAVEHHNAKRSIGWEMDEIFF